VAAKTKRGIELGHTYSFGKAMSEARRRGAL